MSKESKAKEYAQSVADSIIEKALEAAYLEGFNAGVESVEHPVTTIVEDGVTYVDLGLPSGTMWSEYLWPRGKDSVQKSYFEALEYSIPNKEQVEELINNSRILVKSHWPLDFAVITGPNGKTLHWGFNGVLEKGIYNEVAFWMCEKEIVNNNAQYCSIDGNGIINIRTEFTGSHMYLALVKTKE